ncbi:DEAD/DEAH box helicase [Plastorhodobacter daqingensis]|uniref:Transcription-repair-coupling factor n=1 Tax=Plastorhodobacter daqingensis TaxID=1387281 RepID=A0ABW2UJ05_9RHOB
MEDTLPAGAEAARVLEKTPSDAVLLHLARDDFRAEEVARALRGLDPAAEVIHLPPWDCLPYDGAAPTPGAVGRRMAALWQMGLPAPKRARSGRRIVVTPPRAALQRLVAPGQLPSLLLRTGDSLDPEILRRFCDSAGFRVDERVDEPGEVSFLGGVIDIFPGQDRLPCRVELAGTRIGALRRFDPVSQRSLQESESLLLVPVEEAGAEAGQATLADYLPDARLSLGPGAAAQQSAAWDQIGDSYAERLNHDQPVPHHVTPPERLYLSRSDWQRLWPEPTLIPAEAAEPVPDFAATAQPRRAMVRYLRMQAEAGRRCLLVAPDATSAAAMAAVAQRALGRGPGAVRQWSDIADADPAAVLAAEGALDHGFSDAALDLVVIAAPDLLGGSLRYQDRDAPTAEAWQTAAAELHPGDLVVHLDHGLARLEGTEQGPEGETLRLCFAQGQRLLVPVAEAGRIWRYGATEGAVMLDRLGGTSWIRRRRRVQQGLQDTARRLISLAEARQQTRVTPLLPPRPAYDRFEARFSFAETADQRRAIHAVLQDLARDRPMDRLVVGDVGFGKTEVALRAAAAVALSGRQVAVVAPTTVLARQHYETFRRRFAGLGVKVGHLSRLTPRAEATALRRALAAGDCGLVVGTHALLGKAVSFADLALLVIDEEQRFGAAHKRALRRLGQAPHVLSMTATPIPRTLQAALVGLQDMSVINTPPARRRPIRTLLADQDLPTLRQALMRERQRGGQSFVIVPRVEDIPGLEALLRETTPDLALRVAHGQLPPREIDETMVGFAAGEGDVLLATSIVESGLDVPRANTMIVFRPQLFGLTQLHQLRGRVGRSHQQAYCYLLTDPADPPSEAALQRLQTLQALDRLGAGMALSAQDLDMRGAGDLFGERQTGHIRLIGLPLYQELLGQALRATRGDAPPEHEVTLQIGAVGAVPESYLPEPEIRINLYHRLARLRSANEARALAEEIEDRFGPPPPELRDLLSAAYIRAAALQLGITHISAGPKGIALDFLPGHQPDLEELPADRRAALDWNKRRLFWHQPAEGPEALGLVRCVLDDLS